jgi:rSAM/selenodomain-associated transferase 2
MISVIVPTLDEEVALSRLMARLAAESAPHEVIVSDGGSADGTVALAAGNGARIVAGARGRGAQLAAGADAARGELLWFLHADSLPGPGALGAIGAALADPAVVGGNFSLRFDGGTAFDRWLTGFYAWFRRHGLYYGDSGIFVRRAVYRRIGGIRPMALMEDYEFSRRLNRAGAVACIADPPLTTSSRRFQGRRPAAIVAGWLAIHALYHLGAPPALLARLYRSARHAPGRRQRGASVSLSRQS